MNVILVAFIIAIILLLFLEGLRMLLPAILRNSPKASKLALERTAKETEYQNRRAEAQTLVMSRNVLINDRTALETKLLQLQDRQMLLDIDRPLLVVELGDPRPGNRLYLAGVSNRYAVANRVPPGLFETPLNHIWARENSVEIWAPSINEAKNLVDTTYPKARGFEIVFLGEAIDSSVPADAAKGAAL
jgi:hypothetical protein